MRLIKKSELVKEKWFRLLDKSEYSTPLQTPEFYELFNSTKDYSAEVFAVEDNNEYKSLIIVTVQKEKGIKGFFSLRGVVYGGPILISSDKIYLDFLLNEVKKCYKKKLIYLEIRNHADYSSFMKTFEALGFKYEEHLNVELSIENSNIDTILSKMKYNKRREIRLSYEQGASVRLAKDEEEVGILYEILKDIYLKRVKLPLFTFSYFINLYKSKIGKVFVVLHDNKIIGGSFCLYYKGMSINTFYYVGLRDYHKKIFPTHLAVMGAIEFAIENNLKSIDFMGAGKPNINYGVRDYKLHFGGDLVNYGRFNIIFKPLMYKLGILGLNMLSKLK